MTRHIGGSILPSSDVLTLQTKSGIHGVFQVRALPEDDTHAVYFARTADDLGNDEKMIASHPNGFKCDTFAKRTITAWVDGVTEPPLGQFDYILACGGKGIDRDLVEALVLGDIEKVYEAGPSLRI